MLLSESNLAHLIYFLLYVPAAILAMMSLFKAWTTDPGAVPLGARPLTIVRHASSFDSLGRSAHSTGDTPPPSSSTMSNGVSSSTPAPPAAQPSPTRALRRCHKCGDNYKPPRAHHDSVTGRCIIKFDHFCPWVGNAVGAMNHKFFCLFLFYTAITCMLSLLLLLLRTFHCGHMKLPEQGIVGSEYGEKHEGEREDGNRFLLLSRHLEDDDDRHRVYRYPECATFYSSYYSLGLLMCSLIFLVFTCSMGCEQLDAVETGRGKIARMKMKVGSAGTEFQRVTEEFNEMFGGESPHVALHWFLPTDIQFPRGMKKVVLGYEWDESFDPEPYEPSPSSSDDGGSVGAGDEELDDMEGGGNMAGKGGRLPSPTRMPSRDVLDSSNISDVSSVGSDSSRIKNRKPPPKHVELGKILSPSL